MPEVRLIDGNRLAELLESAAERGAGVLATVYRDAAHIARTAQDIEAEPVRHGRWIPQGVDCRGYTSIFECSVCGCDTFLELPYKECEYEYCPHCGARMDGGAENDT